MSPAKPSMTPQNICCDDHPRHMLYRSGTVFLSVLTIFFIGIILCAILMVVGIRWNAMGSGTIVVNGTGEVLANPDTAVFSLGITSEGSELAEAQRLLDEKSAKVVTSIKSAGVADEDIKTFGYTLNPKYEYQQSTKSCLVGAPCFPEGKQVLVGYEGRQSIEVTIRDLANVSRVVGSVGQSEIADIYGPNFEIEDRDALVQQARDEAIQDAQTKAQELADTLGVRLGKMVNYDEGFGSDFGFYDQGLSMKAVPMMADGIGISESSPTLPTGQNEITSQVSLTFRIR